MKKKSHFLNELFNQIRLGNLSSFRKMYESALNKDELYDLNEDGITLLGYSIRYSKVEFVKFLLEDKKMCNSLDYKGDLAIACIPMLPKPSSDLIDLIMNSNFDFKSKQTSKGGILNIIAPRLTAQEYEKYKELGASTTCQNSINEDVKRIAERFKNQELINHLVSQEYGVQQSLSF